MSRKPAIKEVLDTNKTDGLVLTLKENGNNAGTDISRELYSKLPLTEEEEKILYQIIDSIGSWSFRKLIKTKMKWQR